MGLFNLGDVQLSDELEVFILEDTPLYQKRLITCLKSIGFKGRIIVAASLAEAKKLIQTENPSLILSDWNLPDGVGIDFVKLIRAEKKFDSVPVLMVTTMDDASNMIQALQKGADDYIVKPFYENDVIEKLSFAFEKRKGTGLSLELKLSPKLSF